MYGLIKYFPGESGRWLRHQWAKRKLQSCGNNVTIRDGVHIHFPQNVSIGNYVSLNENVFLDGMGNISIGNYCRIAHSVSILSSDHTFSDLSRPIYKQGSDLSKTIIEEDVWIGAKATILRGITIGKGRVIGANAVVTKDIPSYCVAVGNPAQLIKKRGFSKK